MGVTKRGHRPPQGQVLPLHQPHLEPKTPNGGAKGGAPHQVPLSSSGDAPGSGAGGVWVPWGGCSPTQPPDPSASEGCQPPYPHHPTGAGKHKRAWGGHPHVPPSPPIIAPRARGTGGTRRLLRPNPGFPWGQGPPVCSQGWGGAPCHPVWHCCTCRCHFPRATAGATWMSPSPCCQHTAGTVPRAPRGSLLGRWLRTRGGDTAATLGSLSRSWQSPALCAGPAAALLLGTAGSATGRGSVPPGHRARPPLCDPANHS